MIFLDEFGVHTAMSRPCARALRGTRAVVHEPFERGPNHSVISALSLTGIEATMCLEGAVDAPAFEAFVAHLLVPKLSPGEIVILDNVRFHHTAQVRQLIEQAGAQILHLPAYSPDFNPIEECISKTKAFLRSVTPRTKRTLFNALAKAQQRITFDDICGWFLHCGYSYSFI